MLKKIFVSCFVGIVMSLAIALTACESTTLSRTQPSNVNSLTQLQIATVEQSKVAMGQTVYVPVYSHIYQFNSQDSPINLATTLSIRNTDERNPIIITAVRYFNTRGELVKTYLEKPVTLQPLASTEVFIGAEDTTGGSGANFIVEWVAKQKVYEPVIEAVMISTASTQGIAFISPGKVLKQQ